MRVDEHSRLRSLAITARILSHPHPIPRLLEIAAEEVCRTLPAASASVSRIEPDGQSVRTLVNVGVLGPGELPWPERELHPMPELEQVDPEAPDVDSPIVWRWAVDDRATPASERTLLRRLGKRCSVSGPLVVDGRLWGELWASRLPDQPVFDDDDAAYFEGLLAILAGALSRADREHALSELAYRDPLTGLLNRRAIDERARVAFDVPPGARREVVVVAADINGLKAVNDQLGHQAGDELLQHVARSLEQAFAGIDDAAVARVGGDEFNVLVTDRPLAEVVAVVDALAERCEQPDPPTSLSCGAAACTLTAESRITPAALFASADHAQYVAKRERRRRTELAPPSERVAAS